jgi:hypothetical protein
MNTYAEKSTENKSRAMANNLSGQTAGRMPPAQAAKKPGVVQRIIAFAADVDAEDRRIIDIVLNTNPVLRAVWDWLTHHGRHTFTVKRTAGYNQINARFGDVDISFSINPLTTNDAGQRVRNDARWISTISHELTLHLLPWARVVMFHELNGGLTYSEAGIPAQLNRMRVVLGPMKKSNILTRTWRLSAPGWLNMNIF